MLVARIGPTTARHGAKARTRVGGLHNRRQCGSCTGSADTSPPPDHRHLGTQQKLFMTSVYSPGSPIFLARGTVIFNRLVGFLRDKYVRHGFQEVITPTMYKKTLWARSGHLANYADDMFSVSSMSSPSAGADVDDYGLKPMNCPGHCLIFASERRSYRDLPLRLADFGALHRDEPSGALSGLTRVRRFHQDDGHVFCRPSQVEQEVARALALVREAYAALGLGPYRLTLSTRPEDGRMLGHAADWDRAEAALRRVLDRTGLPWSTSPGDGAFYGPKIDVMLKDSDAREHQTATVQLDFQLPRRFALEYHAPAPELEQAGETTTDPERLAVYGPVRPVMIHRAVFGSVERLMALLVEHYNGKWPFWLNPSQAIIITVNDTEPVVHWARRARNVLLGVPDDLESDVSVEPSTPTHLTVDMDDSPRSLARKVREAKEKGYAMIVVVGEKNVTNRNVTVDATGIQADSTAAPIHMTPEALLSVMKRKVELYQ